MYHQTVRNLIANGPDSHFFSPANIRHYRSRLQNAFQGTESRIYFVTSEAEVSFSPNYRRIRAYTIRFVDRQTGTVHNASDYHSIKHRLTAIRQMRRIASEFHRQELQANPIT